MVCEAHPRGPPHFGSHQCHHGRDRHLRQGRVLRRMKIKQTPRGEEIHLRGFGAKVQKHRIQEDRG